MPFFLSHQNKLPVYILSSLSCIGVVLVVFDGIMARYLKSLYLVLINIISLCREIRNEVLIN